MWRRNPNIKQNGHVLGIVRFCTAGQLYLLFLPQHVLSTRLAALKQVRRGFLSSKSALQLLRTTRFTPSTACSHPVGTRFLCQRRFCSGQVYERRRTHLNTPLNDLPGLRGGGRWFKEGPGLRKGAPDLDGSRKEGKVLGCPNELETWSWPGRPPSPLVARSKA